MQAAWQALQPMQRLTSISFATSASWSRAEGGVAVEAEIRMKSCDCRSATGSLPHADRRVDFLDVHQEGLELGRLRVGVPHRRGQRVGAVAFQRLAGEAPVERHADHVGRLAVDHHRRMRLVT